MAAVVAGNSRAAGTTVLDIVAVDHARRALAPPVFS